MRTRRMHNADGQLTGFEIGNALITRLGVLRILERIPGVVITKRPRWWRSWEDDDFVHFTLNGHTFLAIEPFGDNDCYWIVAEDTFDIPEIDFVRREFDARRAWG